MDSAEKYQIYNVILENQSLRKLPQIDDVEEFIAGLIWKQILLESHREKDGEGEDQHSAM